MVNNGSKDQIKYIIAIILPEFKLNYLISNAAAITN